MNIFKNPWAQSNPNFALKQNERKGGDFAKWIQSPEAAKVAHSAEDKAWAAFEAWFPKADKSKFVAQTNFAQDHTAKAEIFYKAGEGSLQSVSGSDRRYWNEGIKIALGLKAVYGFPFQLTLRGKGALPVPATPFSEEASSLLNVFDKNVEIFVTPDESFTTKFREVFVKTELKHTSGVESKRWLRGPNMSYWTQQLNFAVFCATTGCGISREIFEANNSVALPQQVRAFYLFHVYFTIRRILYQLGGIQGFSALPGDPTFDEYNNKYDSSSFKRLCSEFGVDPTTDFRFTKGPNHGLGSVYIYCRDPFIRKDLSYPSAGAKFDDEDPKASEKGISVCFIRNDAAKEQFNWFAPQFSTGLTQAGLSRINQSIEAFVYCILGSQVNVRSSILGSGGRAKEAQTEFLVLVEDAIRQPDLAKSVQRFQLAVDEAKVRLNLAVCPGAWLMPARMVINTESTVGYNKKLKQAVQGMKLGVNDSANKSTKKAALQLMDGGKSKINPPNSHPSNPVHKAATAESKKETNPAVKTPETKTVQTEEPVPTASSGSETHDVKKTAVFVAAVAVAGLAFLTFR